MQLQSGWLLAGTVCHCGHDCISWSCMQRWCAVFSGFLKGEKRSGVLYTRSAWWKDSSFPKSSPFASHLLRAVTRSLSSLLLAASARWRSEESLPVEVANISRAAGMLQRWRMVAIVAWHVPPTEPRVVMMMMTAVKTVLKSQFCAQLCDSWTKP